MIKYPCAHPQRSGRLAARFLQICPYALTVNDMREISEISYLLYCIYNVSTYKTAFLGRPEQSEKFTENFVPNLYPNIGLNLDLNKVQNLVQNSVQFLFIGKEKARLNTGLKITLIKD